MRNFRTTAVASATALTVFVGGTAIASAQDADKPATPNTNASSQENGQDNTKQDDKKKGDKQVIFVGKQEGDKSFGEVISDGTKGLFDGKGSSKYFNQEVDGTPDAERPFYPTDAFGKKTNPEAVPQWARYWIDGTIVAGIGALVGLVIAGINFASYNGFIQLPKF